MYHVSFLLQLFQSSFHHQVWLSYHWKAVEFSSWHTKHASSSRLHTWQELIHNYIRSTKDSWTCLELPEQFCKGRINHSSNLSRASEQNRISHYGLACVSHVPTSFSQEQNVLDKILVLQVMPDKHISRDWTVQNIYVNPLTLLPTWLLGCWCYFVLHVGTDFRRAAPPLQKNINFLLILTNWNVV